MLLTIVLFAYGYFSGPVGSALAHSTVALAQDINKVTASGANLTVAATDMIISVSRASISIAEEFWKGVDLHDTVASVQGSQWIMHRAYAENLAFFDTELGKQLVNIPREQQKSLLVAARGVSIALPVAKYVEASVCFNSSFREFSFQATFLPNGYIGMQYVYINVSFRAQWANPTWSLLELDPATEIESIKLRLSAALREWPETYWHEKPFQDNTHSVLTVHPSLWLHVQYVWNKYVTLGRD